jgi:hypothetical protein
MKSITASVRIEENEFVFFIGAPYPDGPDWLKQTNFRFFLDRIVGAQHQKQSDYTLKEGYRGGISELAVAQTHIHDVGVENL